MHHAPTPQQPHRASPGELAAFILAYLSLLVSRWEALDQQLDPRSRPVGLRDLKERGLNEPLLLWMLYQDHVEHVRPASAGLAGQGVPDAGDSLRLTEKSAFALTERGEHFVDAFLAGVLSTPAEFDAAWDALVLGRLLPCYDISERHLAWGRTIVKVYRQPSANQELILRTAQELGWPEWFDDPLPREIGRNSKVRLHDAIKALNRYQSPHLLHFKGDGTGTRIGWEYR